jgi:hypothetical protein
MNHAIVREQVKLCTHASEHARILELLIPSVDDE